MRSRICLELGREALVVDSPKMVDAVGGGTYIPSFVPPSSNLSLNLPNSDNYEVSLLCMTERDLTSWLMMKPRSICF